MLRLRDIRTQATAVAGRTTAQPVKDASADLAAKLTAIEETLIQVRSEDPRMFPSKLNSRLATVLPLVEYSDSPPTKGLRDLYDHLAALVDAELAKPDRVLADDVPAFNALCRQSGVDAVAVSTPRH